MPRVVSSEPGTTDVSTLSLHDALPTFSRWLAAQLEGAAGDGDADHAGADDVGAAGAGDAGHAGADDADAASPFPDRRSEEHTSELQSRENLVCRLLLEKKKRCGREHPPCRRRSPRLRASTPSGTARLARQRA